MTVRVHKLIDLPRFEEVKPEYDEAIQKRLAWLAEGKADVQQASLSILRFSFWNGCIAIITGRDDAEALRRLHVIA